eukprot:2260-Heterococcus_DN1.PRE.2
MTSTASAHCTDHLLLRVVTALCISQPENFLFKRPDDDVEIKIIDFGLSRFEEANSAMTTRVGTPYYIGKATVHHSTLVSL